MRNIEMMLNKNKDLHKVKKKRFLLKLKKFFFENRLVDSSERRDYIQNLRLNNLPRVPLTFSDDIYDNIYDSFSKIKLESMEDFEKLMTPAFSPTIAEYIEVARRKHAHRMVRLNGYDPLVESKYWKTYTKYRDLNKKQGEDFERRQKQRNKLREEFLKNQERIQHLTKENQQKYIDDIINQELGNKYDQEESTEKSLTDLIDD